MAGLTSVVGLTAGGSQAAEADLTSVVGLTAGESQAAVAGLTSVVVLTAVGSQAAEAGLTSVSGLTSDKWKCVVCSWGRVCTDDLRSTVLAMVWMYRGDRLGVVGVRKVGGLRCHPCTLRTP